MKINITTYSDAELIFYYELLSLIRLHNDRNKHISCEVKLERVNTHFYGLPSDIVGKYLHDKGTVYKITGFDVRKPKMPVLIERIKDKAKMKCPISMITSAITRGDITDRPFKSKYAGDEDFEQALLRIQKADIVKLDDINLDDINFEI